MAEPTAADRARATEIVRAAKTYQTGWIDPVDLAGQIAAALVAERERGESLLAYAKQTFHERTLERDAERRGREQAEALVEKLAACLRDLAGSPAEFDESRVGSVVMQVDRGTLGEARALLAAARQQQSAW